MWLVIARSEATKQSFRLSPMFMRWLRRFAPRNDVSIISRAISNDAGYDHPVH